MRPPFVLVATLAAVLTAGCAPVAAARLGVCQQLRKGLDLAEQTVSDSLAVSDALAAAERSSLDDAFDADARSAAILDPDWVIEARAAYGIGIDRIHEDAASRRAASERALGNLAAARSAVDRLERLDRLELDLANLNLEQE